MWFQYLEKDFIDWVNWTMEKKTHGQINKLADTHPVRTEDLAKVDSLYINAY